MQDVRESERREEKLHEEVGDASSVAVCARCAARPRTSAPAALLLLLAGCGSPQNSAESGAAPASTAAADSGGSPGLPSEVLRSVSLTVSLNESGTAATRSLTRTAIGTFEEITTLHINARRQGRESLVYAAPGAALSGSASSWSGTLDGLIVNETYTFFLSGKNVSGVEIFTGQTSHVVQGDGGSNALSVSLNPVLNDRELTVPVIKSVSRSETVGKTLSTTIRATVENQDNGTLKWRFEVFEVDGFGFANPCAASACGSFAPGEGSSAVGSDNVTHSGSKHTHLLGSTYTAPDNVSEQNLRVIVTRVRSL